MRTAIIVGLLVTCAPWAGAQLPDQGPFQATDPATRELIQKLLSRIDTLEKRVSELELNAPARTAAPSSVAAVAPALPSVPPATAKPSMMDHDQAPLPEAAQPNYPTLKISGFGDVDYSGTDLHGAAPGFQPLTLLGSPGGFELGQFVLQLSSALSPKVSVFSELSLTARSDGGLGSPPAPNFNFELERLVVRYDVNDHFKLSFGRYHTPINYWNTAYHHGTWLQTSISRPEMVQFGGSFLPVHFVGALAEGAFSAGGLNLNYDFGIGNGRGQVISHGGDFGDINRNRAWLANLFVKPDFLYGLQVGGSIYRDKVNPAGEPGAREWIRSAHIAWQRETPEFIAEFADVTHEPLSGGVTSHSQAAYAQTAYRLPAHLKLWKPYYRFEYIHVPLSDQIFKGLVPSFSASTAGVRYDIASFAAFKFEYRHYIRPNLPSFNGLFAQTSFTF
jgi:hypothetical protein